MGDEDESEVSPEEIVSLLPKEVENSENPLYVSGQFAAIQIQSDRSLVTSLQSSRNTVAKLDMVHTHAAYTLNALAEQSEKLDKAQTSIDTIQQSVKLADSKVKELDRLRGWLPSFKIPFPKLKFRKPTAPLSTASSKNASTEDLVPHSESLGNIASDVTLSNLEGPPPLHLLDEICPREQANREIDQNLDTISNSLKMLKLASMAMSLEIENQNGKIERLGGAVDVVVDSISTTNGKLKKIA
ncbi:UNVERIFIED_CONTAM: hypothetical protein HDU68_000994 [Siphonaria sp. JEL0065]|nr:hypothetical protein HDU68_000994 [Siphonaria sp. JEL0065]